MKAMHDHVPEAEHHPKLFELNEVTAMPVALYRFRLDHFTIATPRSTSVDTDWAAVTVTVNGEASPTQTKKIGDVNSDNNPVGVWLDIDLTAGVPEARIDYAFLIQNLGYKGSAEDQSNKALDWVSSECKDIITAAFGAKAVWDEVDSIIQDINQFIFADCDGPVAADKLSWTGSDLADTIANSPDHTLLYQHRYPGTTSHDLCGSNSDYTVYWSVTQKAVGDLYWISNRASNLILQVPKGSMDDGTVIQQGHDLAATPLGPPQVWNQGGPPPWNQQWIVAPTGDGYVRIINMATSKLMDVPGSATGNGVLIQQYRENGGGNNQQWLVIPTDAGFAKIQSRATGKMLDVNGSSTEDGLPIQQWDDNGGGANQQWKLNLVGIAKAPPWLQL
jgi:hypothetical protein